MQRLFVISGLLLLLAIPARAQKDYPPVELFGGFSLAGGRSLLAPRVVAPGWQGTVHLNFTSWFGVNADFARQYRSGIEYRQFLFGPRLVGRNTDMGTVSITFANVGFTRLDKSPLLGTSPVRPETDFAINMFGMAVDGDINDWIAIRVLQFDLLAVRREEFPKVRWRGIGRVAAGVVIKLGRR